MQIVKIKTKYISIQLNSDAFKTIIQQKSI